MTCEEFNIITRKHPNPQTATVAEVAAVSKHIFECPSCMARARKAEEQFAANHPRLSPEDIVANTVAHDVIRRIYNDPEAAEMVDAARDKWAASNDGKN